MSTIGHIVQGILYKLHASNDVKFICSCPVTLS